MSTEQDLINQMNEAEKETGSADTGGGALFAKVVTDWGYKVFVSGSSHEDSFFQTPFPPKGNASKAAFEKAKLYKQTSGASATPAFSWVMSIAPVDVIGKAVNWKASQHKVFTRWKRKDAAGESKSVLDDILLPELVKLKMLEAGAYFVRIRYLRNPITPGTDDNPDLLWLPAEVFATEAECRAAAEKFYGEQDNGSVVSTEELPPDWDAKTWGQFKPQIEASLKAKEAPAAVAAQWGIPVPWMVKFAATVK